MYFFVGIVLYKPERQENKKYFIVEKIEGLLQQLFKICSFLKLSTSQIAF